jgi:hypothetical protein
MHNVKFFRGHEELMCDEGKVIGCSKLSYFVGSFAFCTEH